MASSVALLNSLRWGGLVLGVGYGFMHSRTLTKEHEEKLVKNELKHKEKLIRQAKKEFARKQAEKSNTVITDPSSPNFDLEKLLLSMEKSH